MNWKVSARQSPYFRSKLNRWQAPNSKTWFLDKKYDFDHSKYHFLYYTCQHQWNHANYIQIYTSVDIRTQHATKRHIPGNILSVLHYDSHEPSQTSLTPSKHSHWLRVLWSVILVTNCRPHDRSSQWQNNGDCYPTKLLLILLLSAEKKDSAGDFPWDCFLGYQTAAQKNVSKIAPIYTIRPVLNILCIIFMKSTHMLGAPLNSPNSIPAKLPGM